MDDQILELANRAVEIWVQDGKRSDVPDELPPALTNSKRGCFVSLKKGGKLRGCIGTYEPAEENVAEEIVRNAIQAAHKDPRFPPVEESELDQIFVSVDILSKPEPCDTEDLDPRKFGVIVQQGARRGVLLPDLEGVNTVSEQVEIARRKAGISSDQEYDLMRFEVDRYESNTPVSS